MEKEKELKSYIIALEDTHLTSVAALAHQGEFLLLFHWLTGYLQGPS